MSADLLKYLVERVEKIDNKVDQLLAFKYQIIGGSVVLSVLITSLINVGIKALEKSHSNQRPSVEQSDRRDASN